MLKQFCRTFSCTSALLLSPFISSPALSQDATSYVSIFGGVNYAPDSDLRVELTGPVTILGTMYYQSGAIGGLAVGRRWASGYAIEGELALSRDNFDYETLVGVGTLDVDGGIKTLTLMVNGLHHFESGGTLTPYVGAGAGIAVMSVSALATGSTARFRDTDVGFAYQGIVGVSYEIGAQRDIALEFRHSGSSNARFTDDPDGSGSVTTEIDRANNSVLLKMSYSF